VLLRQQHLDSNPGASIGVLTKGLRGCADGIVRASAQSRSRRPPLAPAPRSAGSPRDVVYPTWSAGSTNAEDAFWKELAAALVLIAEDMYPAAA
jgi:hypothetical protein